MIDQTSYLNIGCGRVKLAGFINIDLEAGADIQVDVTTGLPFPDQSVSGIYSEHFIEHLSQPEILAFLRECRRILVPGGRIRIATPDLDEVIRQYAENDWQQPWLKEYGFQWIDNKAEYLNTTMREWGHAWVVNEEELVRLATFAGLQAPVRCSLGESADHKLSKLETRIESTLVMEFSKEESFVAQAPLVTIIIPAFRSDFLHSCLESATTQTYQALEILVLDDSRDDKIERIAQQFSAHDPRVVYMRNTTPLGEPDNLTNGICQARGEFIKPLYDDDTLAPDAVERLLNAFRAFPDARLAAGRRIPIDPAGNAMDETILGPALALKSGRVKGLSVIGQIESSGINSLGEPTVMMFRRADAMSIDEPNVMSLFGRLCYGIGDVCFALHLLSRGDLAYIAEPIARFRIHPGQTQRQPGFRETVQDTWAYFRQQVARLGMDGKTLAKHRSAPQIVSKDGATELEQSYSKWLKKRNFISEDILHVENVIRAFGTRPPKFQILQRIQPGNEALLADTLESLNNQFYGNWRIDVVTTLPAPDGLESIQNLGWHVVSDSQQNKATLDFLATAQGCDWIVELPPGTVLDPMCLWRIGYEAQHQPEATAFFVDDDIAATDGSRHQPRFKNQLNLEWSRSADIVGPLFLRRSVMKKIGGISECNGSPWYDMLLRLLESEPVSHLRHLPDILLTYPNAFPSEQLACMNALANHLTRLNEDSDVMPTSPCAWRVLYHHQAKPLVSIIIPSGNALEFIEPCINGVLEKTAYENYELIVLADLQQADPDTKLWLAELQNRNHGTVRVVEHCESENHSQALNFGAQNAAGEYLLFLKEDTRILQAEWLDELLHQGQRPTVGAVSPRLVQPNTGLIENAGYVLGMTGTAGSPHRGSEKFSDDGYMDMLQVGREIPAAPISCLLVRKRDFDEVGGFDADTFPRRYADVDFSQKLRKLGRTIIYTPTVTVVHYGDIVTKDLPVDASSAALNALSEAQASASIHHRWRIALSNSEYWSQNLSLEKESPEIDSDALPTWRYLPAQSPRFFSRPLPNGQGLYRITLPLRAARRAGLAQECDVPQGDRSFSPVEIARLGADSMVVQHFLTDRRLIELHEYRKFSPESFIVYSCDDLITDMPLKSHFRKLVPADARGRFKAALRDCNRLVVSTDYLAETFQHFSDDIRVVPNRIERDTWLSLTSQRRTGPRPRIGWAGGTGHTGDLELIKPIIEATRHEADWIFFGMCPEELRPLLAEYHELAAFDRYPANLAALNLDIAVAPLEDIPFNRGKSNLRLIEYGALGLPVVCSDIEPYRNSPARRVANDPEKWIAALRERIYDLDAAEREGESMKRWVLQNYILEDHHADWLDAHLPKK